MLSPFSLPIRGALLAKTLISAVVGSYFCLSLPSPYWHGDKEWAFIAFYQFQLSSQSQAVQVYQSAAYSSSTNHLFCDRLSIIVQSGQFGRSQWETETRRGFICYCLINAINISCNKWTHFPLILCYTFSLSGQMGNWQHLGFDGTRVTNGSEARVIVPDRVLFQCCENFGSHCNWLNIWQIQSTTNTDISNSIQRNKNQNHLSGKLKEKHCSRK